jgi:CheY-like chemotaxis protein
MPIRVLIVDDHPVVRSGLRALLTEADGFEAAGEAQDGIEALAAVRQMRPDVVLMDLTMPKLSGVEAIGRIMAWPETARPAVLVLTMSDDDTSLDAAVRAGARGYLLKDAGPMRCSPRCGRSPAAKSSSAAGWPRPCWTCCRYAAAHQPRCFPSLPTGSGKSSAWSAPGSATR